MLLTFSPKFPTRALILGQCMSTKQYLNPLPIFHIRYYIAGRLEFSISQGCAAWYRDTIPEEIRDPNFCFELPVGNGHKSQALVFLPYHYPFTPNIHVLIIACAHSTVSMACTDSTRRRDKTCWTEPPQRARDKVTMGILSSNLDAARTH